MLVSHTHKFVFIHIYKTAGTSVAKALAPYNVSPHKRRTARLLKRLRAPFPPTWDPGLSVDHKTAIESRDRLGAETFDDFFSFSFVRNPWDWQFSLYQYVLRNADHAQHDHFLQMGSFNRYVQWLCEDEVAHRDDRCQSDFLCNEQGELMVDFVGRFESLASDFADVCQRIGIKATLPRLNSSRDRVDYRSRCNDRSAELIAIRYASDIERFGYRFESAASA